MRDVLFAYNVDLVRGEGGETTWYEGFDTLQRRYVRVVPSAFMAVEYRLFGSNPLPLKIVSLLVHLLNLVLAYRPAATAADPVTAAAVVALVGLHPAAAECVLWFACQPILWAALGSLLAVEALLRLREGATPMPAARLRGRGSGDALQLRGSGRRSAASRRARLALASGRRAAAPERPLGERGPAGGLPGLRGSGALESCRHDADRRLVPGGAGELLANVRADLANYLVKVLPMPPYGAGAYAAIGSWTGAASSPRPWALARPDGALGERAPSGCGSSR